MRTLGTPPASTVASDIAVGSRGSHRVASSNQAANSRNGSSASVKSPVVNQVGCLIEPDSDMLRRIQVVSSAPSSRSGYRATTRQWHATLRRLSTAGALAAAVASGGCSFSYQLDNLFAKEGDATQARSLRPTITKRSDEPTADGDLAIARAAVTEVLTKGGKDASMPWENPDTGARGTITPLASAYA